MVSLSPSSENSDDEDPDEEEADSSSICLFLDLFLGRTALEVVDLPPLPFFSLIELSSLLDCF